MNVCTLFKESDIVQTCVFNVIVCGWSFLYNHFYSKEIE